jgi:hypothetical protein
MMAQIDETGKVTNILDILAQWAGRSIEDKRWLRGRRCLDDNSEEGRALTREALRILKRGITK